MLKSIFLAIIASTVITFSLQASASLTGEEIQARVLPITLKGPDQLSVQIQIKIKPGWHVYGLNPGEMGLPPKLSLQLTDGLVAGDIQWPADHEFEMGEYHCSGYSNDFVVSTSVKVADVLKVKKNGSAMISMSWLACDGETCVPGKAQLNVPITL